MSAHPRDIAHMEDSLPRIFGRYLLVERLSRGGMGEIFLARHGLSGFEKLVVIKKVLPHLAADREFLTRFIDEAKVAVNLQHANVAQVYEVGRVNDEYFLSFEGEVKIIDFGIARSRRRMTETNPDRGFGKFGYLAPEQLLKGYVVDHRTDVYALGVVLFE